MVYGETCVCSHSESNHHEESTHCMIPTCDCQTFFLNNGKYETADELLDKPDMVNHPPHYTSHPSGVECIDITKHYNFCLGNAIKYIWRAGLKKDRLEDLQKAQWYLNKEVDSIVAAEVEKLKEKI